MGSTPATSRPFPLYKKYAKAINVVMALLLVWCAWKIVKT